MSNKLLWSIFWGAVTLIVVFYIFNEVVDQTNHHFSLEGASSKKISFRFLESPIFNMFEGWSLLQIIFFPIAIIAIGWLLWLYIKPKL